MPWRMLIASIALPVMYLVYVLLGCLLMWTSLDNPVPWLVAMFFVFLSAIGCVVTGTFDSVGDWVNRRY